MVSREAVCRGAIGLVALMAMATVARADAGTGQTMGVTAESWPGVRIAQSGQARAVGGGLVGESQPGTDIPQAIRVGLYYGQRPPGSVVVSGKGEWEARNFREAFEGEARVRAGRGELVLEIGERRGGIGPWIELRPAEGEQWLGVEGWRYRGRLRIEVGETGGLKVTNTVGLEDYVRGVVPNEMFSHAEAFKVQAVAARTLAMYVRDIEKKHKADGFDICATGHCQVYRGASSETALADAAVAATRGEVLTCRGRPIFSAYHSNAGGQTQSVDEAWPGSIRADFLYLSPVASPYDVAARELPGFEWCYRWRERLTPKRVQARLRARGRGVGEVENLVVRSRTSTGRVREMEVVGSEGRLRIRGPEEVMVVLGVPSARLEVERRQGCFEITGWGNGHGVGMSQHGALGMAKAGYTYEQILGHFYREVSLTGEYGEGASRALSAPEVKLEVKEVAPVMVPPGQSS